MRLRRWMAALALATSALPASGIELTDVEAAELARRFAESQRALRSLRAAFEQTVSMDGLREPAVSRGRFLFRSPDDVRIDYTEPSGDFFLLRGERFHLSRDGGPTRSYPASDKSARMVVALREVMRGRPEGEAAMTRKVLREGSEYVIILTPKSPARHHPERIESRVDARSLAPRQMTISLPRGTTLKFTFSNPERNVKLDDSVFRDP